MEFSNTNPDYKSLAEIRKEAYEQGRSDQKAEDNEFFNFEGAWRLEKQKIREDAIDEFRERLFNKLCRLTLSMWDFKLFDDILQETYKELKEYK